ncbi:MAG TPA: adenylate kinase [Prolixibacteraceae bacterium]|nr:adenylate kinase [Prolixibacteraceae bacterium]
MLNIVLFGPPGAGKGTQAEFLIQKYQLIHLSTGDLLRSQIAAQTELGLRAKALMDKGELVPDAVVTGMIRSKIKDHPGAPGFIFDGFPRTVAQAEALDLLLHELGCPVSGMLALVVDKQELIDRLLERGKLSGRNDDQDVSIIENRIQVYHQKTAPLMEYYRAQGKFHPIAGVGSIEAIALRIETVIKQW